MLNDKQILSVSASAQLSLLLDTASLSGEAERMDVFQQMAANRLLEYCNVADAHARFVQWAGKTSAPIPRVPLLELKKDEHGPSVLHCARSESLEQDWLLQPHVLSLEQRLRCESHQLWGDATSQEVEQLLALILAAAMMEEVPPRASEGALEPCLLVTTRSQLLEQQTQVQKFSTDKVLRIVDPGEAARILDLWLKSRGHYLLRHDVSCGDYAWYQAASLSDLPRSDGEDTLLESLRQRMALIRYGIDVLGEAYYARRTGDALMQQEYYFMSVTLLLTAMLDSLAVLVNRRLPTGGDKDYRVNLSPPHFQDVATEWPFCERVEQSYHKISAVWTKARPFLVLLYHEMRNPIAHEAMPAHFAHYYGNTSEGQSAGTMGVPLMNDGIDITGLRAMCDEAPLPYEHYTNLGFSRQDFHGVFGDVQQFEPYLFCRAAWSRCRVLVNTTLELLGYLDVLTSTNAGMKSPVERAVMFRKTALDGLEFVCHAERDLAQQTPDFS